VNLTARGKDFDGILFNRSGKTTAKYETCVNRMICSLHIPLFETTRKYSSNSLYLEVLLMTECYTGNIGLLIISNVINLLTSDFQVLT